LSSHARVVAIGAGRWHRCRGRNT